MSLVGPRVLRSVILGPMTVDLTEDGRATFTLPTDPAELDAARRVAGGVVVTIAEDDALRLQGALATWTRERDAARRRVCEIPTCPYLACACVDADVPLVAIVGHVAVCRTHLGSLQRLSKYPMLARLVEHPLHA